MFYRIASAIWLTYWACLIFIGSGASQMPFIIKLLGLVVLTGCYCLGWASAEEHAITKRKAP